MRGTWLIRSLIALACLCLALPSTAGDTHYDVIVHPDNPITEIDRDALRDAFLKKSTQWSSGDSIRPIDLPSGGGVRDRFTQDVIRKTPEQLKNYWNQQIFSGKGVPPPEADSVAQAIAYVLATPGAVGYIPAGTEPRGAKVIRIR